MTWLDDLKVGDGVSVIERTGQAHNCERERVTELSDDTIHTNCGSYRRTDGKCICTDGNCGYWLLNPEDAEITKLADGLVRAAHEWRALGLEKLRRITAICEES